MCHNKSVLYWPALKQVTLNSNIINKSRYFQKFLSKLRLKKKIQIVGSSDVRDYYFLSKNEHSIENFSSKNDFSKNYFLKKRNSKIKYFSSKNEQSKKILLLQENEHSKKYLGTPLKNLVLINLSRQYTVGIWIMTIWITETSE